MDEWAEFDFIGSAGPWVSTEKYRRIERFKFYSQWAGGRRVWYRRPLQAIARWRCQQDFYGFPIEKVVVGWLRPSPRMA
ncbi:MAG: hypothetical protein NZ742_06315 [Acidobacteria bacterium]|nr:hypothetical protein [Acidobacteriota bacterium]MDW7984480.1 hypothetical protein [Acidobacteriota bacterium]